MCISGRLQLSQSCHWCHLLCFCRCEREQLYKHWLNTLASDWGNDISNLVSQLEVEQVRLTKLYDQAGLQVCHPNAAAVAQIALSSMLILDHLSYAVAYGKSTEPIIELTALQILREACIVGMTTTGLAKQQGLLHALQPKVSPQQSFGLTTLIGFENVSCHSLWFDSGLLMLCCLSISWLVAIAGHWTNRA